MTNKTIGFLAQREHWFILMETGAKKKYVDSLVTPSLLAEWNLDRTALLQVHGDRR